LNSLSQIQMPRKLPTVNSVDNRVPRLLCGIAFFTLIVIAALRPLIAESYDSSPSSISLVDHNISDPMPIRTLVIDLAILAAGGAWWIANRKPGSTRYRWTGLEPGLVIIAGACLLSCATAGNKRLAINASLDWLCTGVLGLLLIQLIRAPWQRSVLLAAVLASGAVQFAQCVDQRASTSEMWKQYEETKTEFWRNQGIDPESNHVALFEARMKSNESSGFLPHSNVTGAYFAMCGLAAIGVTLGLWREPPSQRKLLLMLGTLATIGVMIAGIVMTRSRGAVISFVIALIAWLIVSRARNWIDAHRRTAFIIGWAAFVLVLAAVIGHGIYHGSLPTASLAFRWQYWRNSMGMIADHWFRGVGRENFGRHYLLYKTMQSPEEISNPHNIFIQSAAEWGILGFVGIVVLLLGASWALSMPRPSSDSNFVVADDATRSRINGSEKTSSFQLTLIGVLILLAITAIRLPLFGTANGSYLYYMSMVTAIVWLPVFICVASAISTGRDDRVMKIISAGVAFGLFAFVVQDLISFAMFIPATATTLFALYAYAATRRGYYLEALPSSSLNPFRGPMYAKISTLILAVVAAVALAINAVEVSRDGSTLTKAREAAKIQSIGRPEDSVAANSYEKAAAADPLDPTPLVELARWLGSVAPIARDPATTLSHGIESIRAARRRDPYSHSLRRLELLLCRDLARRTNAAKEYDAAIRAGNKMLKLYPLDPVGLVLIGELQLEAAKATHNDALRADGVASLQKALDFDSRRPSFSVFQGLTQSERDRAAREIADASK